MVRALGGARALPAEHGAGTAVGGDPPARARALVDGVAHDRVPEDEPARHLRRAHEPGAPTRLDAELAAAEQEGRAERLDLAPLAREAAEALFDDRLDEAERELLYQESGGNPFFLEQLVRHGRTAPLPSPGVEDVVPPAVAAALAGELEDLSAPARALAEGAAVAGEPFELELAASIADLDPALGLPALDELVERDLARMTAAPRRFRFRHPLVRRAVYEGIPLGRRLAAHGRAAEALEARGAPAQSRARHVEQAAAVGDRDAVALLRRAGAEVGARAPVATARWLASAARLSHGGGATDEERVTLLGELADALVAAGRLEESMAAAEEAMTLLRPGDGEQRAMLAARCAASLHRMSRSEDARRHLEQGLESLDGPPSRAAHALRMELALSHLLELRYDDALVEGRRALELAEQIGSRARIASSHGQLALILSSSHGSGEADEHADRAAELIDALPDHRLAGRLEGMWLLASAEIWLERYELALARADRGIRIARESGQSRVLVPLLLARTHPLQMLGRLDEARAVAGEAVEASRLSANPQYPFWARWESAYAAYLCGDLDAGLRLADEAAELAVGALPNLLSAAEPGWTQGQLMIESGERERGHELMLEAVGGPDLPKVVPAERCLAWDVLATNAVELGRLDEARDHRDRLVALSEHLGLHLSTAIARRVCAEVALEAGDAEAAALLAREGAAFAEKAGVLLELPYAHDTTGRALAAAGRPEEAIVELARAEHEFHRFGAARRREAVALQLRKLGRRVDRRGRTTRAGGEGVASLVAPRARGRRARARPQDQPRDRGDALPLRQDRREPPALDLPQARRLLARRRRPSAGRRTVGDRPRLCARPMSFGGGRGFTGMTTSADTSTAARRLRRSFRGPIHVPGDERYDEQRATWTGAPAATPAIVAEALTPADVREAVAVAREHGLRLALQSTGHGQLAPAGHDALLLKTSRMAGVVVDPGRRVARLGAGAAWGDVVAAAAPFGLAPVSGSNAGVGVVGFTLGGGHGWLSRAFGFGADNLLRADVVTADGAIVTADARHNPDLFWALRGGGGNFGVVTAIEIRLHEVASVLGGEIAFARERAPELLAALREGAEERPDELSVTVAVTRESAALRLVYAGAAAEGVRALRPLLDAGGAPLRSDVRPMSVAETTTIPGTPPKQFELYAELGDDVVEAALVAPVNGLEVRQWGGAMARRPSGDVGAGPVGHRDVPFSITVDGSDELLQGLATGGSFLNWLHDTSRTRDAYTTRDWLRLLDFKALHDPDHVFAPGHTMAPSEPAGLTGLRAA